MKQKNCATLLFLLFLLTGCSAAESTDTVQEEAASVSVAQEEASGSNATLEDVTIAIIKKRVTLDSGCITE
ncbi:MAG: hypothetical protein LUD82_07935, partial [Clostridiales bacterium]|nr:hypothetical protein [Clostridiales bacterium]